MSSTALSRLGNVNDFPYQALENEFTIRILILQPADDVTAPIHCSLEHHSRAEPARQQYDSLDYIAISYAWGEPVFSRQIILNGRPFNVTANVECMLRDMRKGYKARWLWIDAICLDQSSNQEKRQQIPLMGKIYAEANKVLIWLGRHTEEEQDQTFAVIRRLRCIQRDAMHLVHRIRIEEFLRHPWWNRRFTIQESVANPCTIVRYRGTTMDWRMLGLCLKVLEDPEVNFNESHDNVGSIAKAYGFWGESKSVRSDVQNAVYRAQGDFATPRGDLLDALWEFHDTECSDPRDRIAALRGLVSSILSTGKMPGAAPDDEWAPDYDRDWKQNFKDFAFYCLKNGGSAKLTRHLLAFGSLNDIEQKVPIWVPNWSISRGSRKSILPESIKYMQEFPTAIMELIILSAPPDVLVVQGSSRPISDEVVRVVGPQDKLACTHESALLALCNLLDLLGTSFPNHQPLHEPEQVLHAILAMTSTETWSFKEAYPLYKMFDVLVDQLVMLARRLGTAVKANRQLAEMHRRCHNVLHKQEGQPLHGLQSDIKWQALYNEIVLPLIHKRLSSWDVFVTRAGYVGASPARVCRGHRAVIDKSSPACWTYLVGSSREDDGLPFNVDVAYAPCVLKAKHDRVTDFIPNTKGIIPAKTAIDEKTFSRFAQEWRRTSPWGPVDEVHRSKTSTGLPLEYENRGILEDWGERKWLDGTTTQRMAILPALN